MSPNLASLAARPRTSPLRYAVARAGWLLLLTLLWPEASRLSAQEALRSSIRLTPEGRYRTSELKKLPLEELLDVRITSASRRPEPIWRAASAIDVVTSDTIFRAGATNLPDALRLAAGLDVAQIDGHSWAISTRGFNLSFNISVANKMEVLMDGRSLYTPLYSGVFWDVQRTFLPDLEQIEVVRGPGATLWGTNAVNGVINIRTKSAEETQGFLLDGGGGNEQGYTGIRYGGRLGRDTYYRAYVMHQRTDSLTFELSGADAQDETQFTQGGFRIDSNLNVEDTLTLQGDGYAGTFGQFNQPNIEVDGNNLIVRWTRRFSGDASVGLQGYYDRTHRLVPNVFAEDRNTFDLQLEGRFVVGQHDVVYGADYRLSADQIGNLGPSLAFLPAEQTNHVVSGYVQDEWHIVPRTFSLLAGSKFEYNTFSGFEVQPTGRFLWNPTENQTVWGAISRAVRTPTRIDQDLFLPNPIDPAPRLIFLRGSKDFEEERLIAYELGYRFRIERTLAFDLAGFYNDYDHLRSQEPGTENDAIFGTRQQTRGPDLWRHARGTLAGDGLVATGWQCLGAARGSASQPRQSRSDQRARGGERPQFLLQPPFADGSARWRAVRCRAALRG